MSLTDDWKNKKLVTQKDYFIADNDEILVAYLDDQNVFYSGDDFIYDETCDFIEVLAPCDYEELLCLKSENKHMKELLKECRTALEIYAKEDETCGLEEENKYAKNLLPRINAAIGKNVTQNVTKQNS